MPDINWRRIEDMPDELRDGRNVLLWEAGQPTVASFVNYAPGTAPFGENEGHWHDERGSLGKSKPSHFAAIEEPRDA